MPDLLLLRLIEVEHQFVMHLEEHPGLQFMAGQLALDVDHRQLDHVGRGALNGGVNGVALGRAAHGVIG